MGTGYALRPRCKRAVMAPQPLGELPLEAGDAVLHLRITPSLPGTRRAALDVVRVILERVTP